MPRAIKNDILQTIFRPQNVRLDYIFHRLINFFNAERAENAEIFLTENLKKLRVLGG